VTKGVTTVDCYGHLKRAQDAKVGKHLSVTWGVHFHSASL